VPLDAGGADLAAAVGVADRLGAHQGRPVDRRCQVGQRVAGRLDQQDVAVGQIAETMSTSSEIFSAQMDFWRKEL
jgi:hypothetical protein